mmetsp:Transcript_10232/g.19667  ORF Transcript_10232/g.19667 Transcript_10232/m.19667 type:complete len:123 (-) Transcript_10232:121-489(-)
MIAETGKSVNITKMPYIVGVIDMAFSSPASMRQVGLKLNGLFQERGNNVKPEVKNLVANSVQVAVEAETAVGPNARMFQYIVKGITTSGDTIHIRTSSLRLRLASEDDDDTESGHGICRVFV